MNKLIIQLKYTESGRVGRQIQQKDEHKQIV